MLDNIVNGLYGACKKALLGATLIGALSFYGCSGEGKSSSDGSGLPGTLVYVASKSEYKEGGKDQNWKVTSGIYSVKPGTEKIHTIVEHSEKMKVPVSAITSCAVASDRRIAFTENDNIYIADKKRNLRQLTAFNSDASPTWSPDGKEIAFSRLVAGSLQDPDRDIYKIDTDGKSRATPLTRSDYIDGSVDWSVNGLLAFSRVSLKPKSFTEPEVNGIYVIRSDGGGERSLLILQAYGDMVGAVNWSSDGKRIVYNYCDNPGENNTYILNVESGKSEKIAEAKYGNRPCFSPDNNWIAYIVAENKIPIVKADGSKSFSLLEDYFKRRESQVWCVDWAD